MSSMRYSIITPVYNREDCVTRCIESVIRNVRPGIELEHIIVDDGSHDETADIVRRYADRYSHIKFIQFPENRGTNAARNTAVMAAHSDFCILLDSDDYFVNDAVAYIDSVVSVSKYRAYMFAPDDMVGYYEKNAILSGESSKILTFRNFLHKDIGGDFIHCISTAILKENPFDEGLRVFEAVFFLRFFKESQEMLFTNRVVVIRERSRKDSVTRTMIASNKKTIEKYYEANLLRYNWFLDDYVNMGELSSFASLLNLLLYYSLLLRKHCETTKWYGELRRLNLPIDKINLVLFKTGLGGGYLWLMKFYFIFKYGIMRRKLS